MHLINAFTHTGTSSRTAGFARALEQKLTRELDLSKSHSNIDGIVAVTHTEGGSETTPHNAELLLRTLAGFAVHPNVGAALLCDVGTEPVNNARLSEVKGAVVFMLHTLSTFTYNHTITNASSSYPSSFQFFILFFSG